MQRIVVLGSLNIDLVIPVERLPRKGETLAGSDLREFTGGKGANQAAAVAKLGGAATMIGQVGSDPFGARLLEELAASGVDTSGIGRSARATGSACIYVLPDGENAIVISPGANATLTPEVAVQRLRGATPYSFLLAQLEIPVDTVIESFIEAGRAGAMTILDPAPFQPIPAALVDLVGLITPNQSEAAALLGYEDGQGICNLEEAAQTAARLRNAGYRGVILKLGELGCYVDTEDCRGSVPAFPVVAVDTTAAGDTFNAALAVFLANGTPLMEAAVFANAAAAISVTRPGAQSSIPAAAEVQAFLANQRAVRCSE